MLPHQRPDVIVVSTLVCSFDPLPRGVVTCAIPGDLVGRGSKLEIAFGPLATKRQTALSRRSPWSPK
jgi:hypothetical protein